MKAARLAGIVSLLVLLGASESGTAASTPHQAFEGISDDELATSIERAALAAELAPLQGWLRSLETDSFGGLWIAEDGVPVDALKGSAAAAIAQIERTDLSVPPRVVSVSFSEQELNSVHAQIVNDYDSLLAAGIEVLAVSTEILANEVEVVLFEPRAVDVTRFMDRYGPSVTVVARDAVALGSVCNRSNCGNPYKAGLNLFRGTDTNPSCTGGFIFRSGTSTYYWSSAGHCADMGQAWSHPAGTSAGSVTHQGWVDNSKAEALLFRLSGASKASNLIFVNDTFLRSVTTKENPDPENGNEVIGESVFKSGMNGITTGTLLSVNVSQFICRQPGPCKLILELRRTSAGNSLGDSGAPMYLATGPTTARALGILSAKYAADLTDSVYSHIRNVEIRFNVQAQLAMP